jgi:hypothetical protein
VFWEVGRKKGTHWKKGTHLFLEEKGDAFIFKLKGVSYAKEGKDIGAELSAPYSAKRAQP